MPADSDHNPFQAPSSGPQEPSLVVWEDCLVTPRRILCKNETTLPKACFFFGCTENLVQHRETLRTLKGTSVLAIIVFVAALLLMMTVVPVAGAALLLIMSALLLALTVTGLWKNGFHVIALTWYVGPKYQRRILVEQIIMRIIIVTVCTVITTAVLRAGESPLLIALTVALGTAAWFGAKPGRKPTLVGKKQEMFIISGHSRKFCEATRGLSKPF